MKVNFDDKVEKQCLKDERETKKINESIFEFGLFINSDTEKKVFNKFKDKYDHYEVNYNEEDLKLRIKNQTKEAYNFTNIIFLLIMVLFSLQFSNMSNGDIILSYFCVSFYIGYKCLMNNYKYLFENFLQMLLLIAIISSLFYFKNKEELIISTKYDFNGLIIPSTNNKSLLINLVTNEVYNLKDVNIGMSKSGISNMTKDCSVLTVDYIYNNKNSYLNDKILIEENKTNSGKYLSEDKTIDFYCSELKNKNSN